MNIKLKMLLGSGLMIIVPLVMVSVIIGWQAIGQGEEAIREQVVNRLIASRDDKAVQITRYFRRIRDQLSTFSQDQMFIDAMLAFKDASANIREELLGEESIDEVKAGLSKYYQTTYSAYFKTLNPTKNFNSQPLYSQLDETAMVLQNQYAVINPEPIGSKENLDDPDDDTLYAQIHSLYHKKFQQFKQRFDYADIYLVDNENDRIVYSVKKGSEFGASIQNDILAQTELAKVYQQAKSSSDPNFVVMSDFSIHPGDFDQVAAFLAAPIIDDEELMGVLIFQIPQTVINSIMTSEQKWQQVGMGETGQTILVGNDSRVRSIHRELLEKPNEFFAHLEEKGNSNLALIKARQSNVLLQSIDTEDVQLAMQGQKGVSDHINSMGIEVLSAYAPISIEGLKWVILSEIDKKEAFAPVEKLSQSIIWSTLTISLSLLAVAIFIGWYFAHYITSPVIKLNKTMKKVTQNSDLTLTIATNRNDELGSMAKAFSAMLDTFHRSIKEVSIAVNYIANAVGVLTSRAEQTQQTIKNQNQETQFIGENINSMLNKTDEVIDFVNEVTGVSNEAEQHIDNGNQIVNDTIRAIGTVSQQIEQSAKTLQLLESESDSIGSVVDVIREIAEQTNLLALNAAIEAARAGEQGRGFAVVADEVRMLAAKTQTATTEIQSMVERLQKGSKDAVAVMESSQKHTLHVEDQSNQVVEAFNTITRSVTKISDLDEQITRSVTEQKAFADEIHQNIDRIREESGKTTEASLEITTSSEVLTELAGNLKNLVNRFKIDPQMEVQDTKQQRL